MTDGYMLNTVVNSGASSVSVSGGKFSQAAFDSVNTILSEQDVQLIEMSPAEADGSFSAVAVGTAAHTHADGDEFTTALSTTGVVTGGSVDGVLAGIFLENGAIEVTVSGGTITGVRAGVLADSSAADIAVSGGKMSSLYVNSGAVSVSGGYFAAAPEVDGCTAVETAAGGEDYGYTLYESGDTSAYAVADVSAVYGESYTYSVTYRSAIRREKRILSPSSSLPILLITTRRKLRLPSPWHRISRSWTGRKIPPAQRAGLRKESIVLFAALFWRSWKRLPRSGMASAIGR